LTDIGPVAIGSVNVLRLLTFGSLRIATDDGTTALRLRSPRFPRSSDPRLTRPRR
jgi:hypothetical protein